MLFQELYALASRSTLSMLIDANADTGLMTISVRPQPKGGQTPDAPSEPLTLTATPAEFDTGFAGAFGTYRTVLDTLQAQADAVTAELRNKSVKATAKPAQKAHSGKPVAPAGGMVDPDQRASDDGGPVQPPAGAPAAAEKPAMPTQASFFD